MEWIKMGQVSGIIDKLGWSKTHAQVPTLLLKEDRLRVYFATRPQQDLTLTTFCDLDLNDLSRILYIHDKPVIETGAPGTFDQHGIMPSSIVEKDGKIYLYYSGWCRSVGVPYNNYTGVAISEDGGTTFYKPYQGPILDRTRFELFSATSPHVHYENKWHMWYCSGTNWHPVNGKLEHTYDIKYASSEDGLAWVQHNQTVIKQKDPFEAITKPTVIKINNLYHMWYCFRGTVDFREKSDSAYRIGYATSSDMVNWERKDNNAGITISEEGWDNMMIAYPAVINIKNSVYLFYNGNYFGKDGFGFAKLKV
jgi:predicted GH43/DUF377 family glycosyl hydrolase